VKAFHALTDAELVEIIKINGVDVIAAHYRDLRNHHVTAAAGARRAETEHLAARDRSAILRMAGNIAGGLVASLNWHELEGDDVDGVAETSIVIARAIVSEVDGAAKNPSPHDGASNETSLCAYLSARLRQLDAVDDGSAARAAEIGQLRRWIAYLEDAAGEVPQP